MSTEMPEQPVAIPGTGANPPPPAPPQAFAGAVLGLALYLLFATGMVLFNLHPPALPPIWWAIITPLSTIAYLFVLVYTIRLICRLPLSPVWQVTGMAGSLGLFAWYNPIMRDAIIRLATGTSFFQVLTSVKQVDFSPAQAVLIPTLLILTGVFFGQLLARIIREKSMLVPVGIIAGLIDFWGVYWGPVGSWSEQTPAAVTSMATAATASAMLPDAVRQQMPEQLLIFGNLTPPSNIGIGDFVFLAFFLTCAYRLGFSARRTQWGIFAGLLIASMLITLDGQTLFGQTITLDYLPGLVFICGGVMLLNWRYWRLSPKEWAMTGTFIAIFGVVISIGVIQAELNKPYEFVDDFTLTAQDQKAPIAEAYARGLTPKGKMGEPLLLAINGDYLLTNGRPVLVEVKVLGLIRPEKPDLRQTFTVFVQGIQPKLNEPRWQFQASTTAPPETAVAYLARGSTDTPATLIANARGLEPEAFTLLDAVPSMSLPGKSRIVRLVVNQQRRVLMELGRGNQEQIIKRFETPTPR